ncbi:MAG: FHA domain-containing protein [Deltaproteobacteria bacterium]|nr:MAG: FHA domain-containing protein [Deltaproteobacteria bacterium]
MASIVHIHEGVVIKKFPLEKSPLRIGRNPDNDIFIDDKVVSMEHAIVEVLEDTDQKEIRYYYIEDLESTNGTHVNGKKITRQKLNHNDIIRVGWNMFKFIDAVERKKEKTLKIHKSWIPRVYYTKE